MGKLHFLFSFFWKFYSFISASKVYLFIFTCITCFIAEEGGGEEQFEVESSKSEKVEVVKEGVASIALLPSGSISGHFIQLPHSICYGLHGTGTPNPHLTMYMCVFKCMLMPKWVNEVLLVWKKEMDARSVLELWTGKEKNKPKFQVFYPPKLLVQGNIWNLEECYLSIIFISQIFL